MLAMRKLTDKHMPYVCHLGCNSVIIMDFGILLIDSVTYSYYIRYELSEQQCMANFKDEKNQDS